MLDAYQKAYAATSLDALRRIQELSAAEADGLKTALDGTTHYRVVLANQSIKFAPDGRSAEVTAEAQRIAIKNNVVTTNSGVASFKLEKRRGGWMIVAARLPW